MNLYSHKTNYKPVTFIRQDRTFCPNVPSSRAFIHFASNRTTPSENSSFFEHHHQYDPSSSTSTFTLNLSRMAEQVTCGGSSGSTGVSSLSVGAASVGGSSVNSPASLPVVPQSSAKGGDSGAAGAGPAAASGSSGAGGGNPMDLASLFECPVCMDFALPPILQCQSGHIVCASCRAKLSSCPTCRGNLENIRNLAMEKLAASVLFPCKYSLNGCADTFRYTEKAEHEATCEHRPYSCPCPGASCKWLGQLDQVMNHLLQSHKSITTLKGEDIVFLATDITLPGAVDWVMMQSCFGHFFMLVLEKQERDPDQLFFALVVLIGTKKQADNFVYRLDLTASTRRLTWEATPHSIHDGVQAAINVSDCLVFDSNTAQLFADSGSLGINVTISKVRGSW